MARSAFIRVHLRFPDSFPGLGIEEASLAEAQGTQRRMVDGGSAFPSEIGHRKSEITGPQVGPAKAPYNSNSTMAWAVRMRRNITVAYTLA